MESSSPFLKSTTIAIIILIENMKNTTISEAVLMISSFQQAEQFINGRNNFGIKLGLQRIKTLLQHVDNPHQKLNAIHVAGTNGKGSTIHLLEKALLESDYTVGVFTSPSFTGIRGHMKVNQTEISEEEFIGFLNKLIPAIKKLDENDDHPTSFEIITVIAFMFFHRHAKFVLIETGMGGKDDTTNVIDPLLSIITNVEKDHTQFLGKTYEEISTHKAGIIKRNRPVIVGKINEQSERVISNKAMLENASIHFYQKDFNLIKSENKYLWLNNYNAVTYSVTLEHLPSFQIDNIAVVLMTLTVLQKMRYKFNLQQFLIKLNNFSLPGRFEIINGSPLILLDSAHNVSAIKKLINAINEKYPTHKKQIIFSAFKDKDVEEMLSLLQDNFSKVILTTFSHKRAFEYSSLQEMKTNKILVKKDWQQLIEKIYQHGDENKLFIITGSLHFIATVRHYILEKLLHNENK